MNTIIEFFVGTLTFLWYAVLILIMLGAFIWLVVLTAPFSIPIVIIMIVGALLSVGGD